MTTGCAAVKLEASSILKAPYASAVATLRASGRIGAKLCALVVHEVEENLTLN